ncbi:uncharacterized protein LOC131674749 [Phymastichus coffea]|uniref:uncharacterized protein LOC131674749 n=1 Tax=Phymastichus coffea TaxID=108790 RepID=UPI00273B2871|nr:uncharacterized protein LOC131674749 [Phymastichus coffea]
MPLRCEQRESTEDIIIMLEALLMNLGNIIDENKIVTFSSTKSESIENVLFSKIINCIRDKLGKLDVKIIVCTGQVKHPLPNERAEIYIQEAHCSAVGGHTGVNITFNRIRLKSNWEHLKEDVLSFIQQCVDCQTKKLVREKTKQKMVVTDSPPVPFFITTMDIAGPMPTTKLNNR